MFNFDKIDNTWKNFFKNENKKEYFIELIDKVDKEYKEKVCYPDYENIFKIFEIVPLNEIKVVIIGQDPYHGPGQAMGLSFSVPNGQEIPPSLVNIFKEIKLEYEDNFDLPKNGDLTSWAKQGVFLLNNTLTVEAHKANSHKDYGWNEFTDNVIKYIDKQNFNKVFVLWGNFAKNKATLIDNDNSLILKSPHPSPLSANKGFFGNNHFKKINEYLKDNNLKEINWNIN